MLVPTNIQAPSTAQLLLKSISRLPISGTARKPFDSAVQHIVLFARAQDKSRRCTMRNHDFVSDGFLAIIAASLVLLCSGLLAIAFS